MSTSLIHDLTKQSLEMLTSKSGEIPFVCNIICSDEADDITNLAIANLHEALLARIHHDNLTVTSASKIISTGGETTILQPDMLILELHYKQSPSRLLTLHLSEEKSKLIFH